MHNLTLPKIKFNSPKEADVLEIADLKDMTGKSIRFGDILIDSLGNLLTPVLEVVNEEHVLFFKPIDKLETPIAMGCKSTYSNTLRIIGNIYNYF